VRNKLRTNRFYRKVMGILTFADGNSTHVSGRCRLGNHVHVANPAADHSIRWPYARCRPVHDIITRFMGLIVLSMGVQFALTGVRAFMAGQ
jgi:hypothetical protein